MENRKYYKKAMLSTLTFPAVSGRARDVSVVTLPFHDFFCLGSVAVDSVYKLHFLHLLLER